MTKKIAPTGPRFVRYFAPVLQALREFGGSATPGEIIARVASDLEISDEEQNEVTSTGQSRFRNAVHWARFYLKRDGLLDESERGVWSLTESGRATSLTDAQALEIFQKLHPSSRSKPSKAQIIAEESSDDSTDPQISHREEALKIILGLPPSGFEKLSQRILREAGFSQVEVTGRPSDGGIDGEGTLQLNLLVSFRVLFQCKRYKSSVSSGAIRDFRGAMAGRAEKGIILTTGTFTTEARKEATRDGVPPIELIDGAKLIDMLENLKLGLKPVQAYEVDHAFFDAFNKP